MKIKAFKSDFLVVVAIVGSIIFATSVTACSGVTYAAENQRQETDGKARGERPTAAGVNNLQGDTAQETVLVARNDDPYYHLAQKIAQTESLRMYEDLADALESRPRFVILVASPDRLTAEMLSSIGGVFEDLDYYPGLGIISGSTLEKAERLWARRNLARAGNNYIGGDVDITQYIYEPTIFDLSDGARKEVELNKDSLIDVLGRADYFYWTRHSGPRDWSWNEEGEDWTENDQLLAKDIPPLKPAVIFSLTCSSFRPWVENSLALGFVDMGASAYLGFVNTPHSAAFMRQGLAVPGVTSWSEFPIGLVAQVQNKTTTATVFSTPQLFMMGDPRVFLSKDRPYEIVSDEIGEDGTRAIKGESDEDGILAVKIDGGAEYGFLRVEGLTSVSEGDLFYNNELQTLNLGGDKYVLFLHHGGQFQVELQKQAPVWWRSADALVDAFDSSWVVLWLSTYADGNPHVAEVSLVLFAGILLFGLLKRKHSIREYNKIFAIALVLALVRLAYFLLRSADYSVSSSPVFYSPFQIALGCIGVFSSVAGGLILMKDSRRRVGKLLGLMLAVLRELWMTGFYLVFVTLLNVVTPITKNTESWLLSYHQFWLSFIVLVFEVLVILVAYRVIAADAKQQILARRHDGVS